MNKEIIKINTEVDRSIEAIYTIYRMLDDMMYALSKYNPCGEYDVKIYMSKDLACCLTMETFIKRNMIYFQVCKDKCGHKYQFMGIDINLVKTSNFIRIIVKETYII